MRNFQKGFVGILILIIVALAFVGGGYYFYQQKTGGSNSSVLTSGSLSTKGSGWKLYTNSEYGFEINVPTNLETDFRQEDFSSAHKIFPDEVLSHPPQTNADLMNNKYPSLLYSVLIQYPQQHLIVPPSPNSTTTAIAGQNVTTETVKLNHISGPYNGDLYSISFELTLKNGNRLDVIMNSIRGNELDEYRSILQTIENSIKITG
jgi:hypothetical protein